MFPGYSQVPGNTTNSNVVLFPVKKCFPGLTVQYSDSPPKVPPGEPFFYPNPHEEGVVQGELMYKSCVQIVYIVQFVNCIKVFWGGNCPAFGAYISPGDPLYILYKLVHNVHF